MSARAILVGKICTNIEVIGNEDNKGVQFSLICKSGKARDFIRCVAWGRIAEVIQEMLGKGDFVEILGRLKVNEYTNKDKIKFRNTFVLIDNIEFINVTDKVTGGQMDLFSEEEEDE
ncbi:MAG: single-stranded DNA-binding protein [Anaerorhabdus sp.]